MAFQVSLFQIIFEQFLKISPDLLSRYSAIQDQLLYLVLIPHVVLLLFLVSFGSWASGGHRKFNLLLSIAAYIFIIWGGWYGTIFVPLTITWFYISIGIAFVIFFLSRVVHPSKTGELFALGVGLHKKLTEKSEKIKALDKEIEKLDRQISSLRGTDPRTNEYRNYLNSQKEALKVEKEHLER